MEAMVASGEVMGAAACLARQRGKDVGRTNSLLETIHLEALETAQISTERKVLEATFKASEWKTTGIMEILDPATEEGNLLGKIVVAEEVAASANNMEALMIGRRASYIAAVNLALTLLIPEDRS